MIFRKNILIVCLLALIVFMNVSYASGEKVFENNCASCHSGGLKGWLSGAPAIGDKSDWSEFFDKNSLETMKSVVLNGENNHKKKGGCEDCSDDDINLAVDYVHSKSK